MTQKGLQTPFLVIFESLLSHLGSLWGGALGVTFESLLGHFNPFWVSVDLGARWLPNARKSVPRRKSYVANFILQTCHPNTLCLFHTPTCIPVGQGFQLSVPKTLRFLFAETLRFLSAAQKIASDFSAISSAIFWRFFCDFCGKNCDLVLRDLKTQRFFCDCDFLGR